MSPCWEDVVSLPSKRHFFTRVRYWSARCATRGLIDFPLFSFQAARILMMLQVFLLLLLSFFTLYLPQLCHLYWTHHCFPHPKAVALHSAVHRLLRPRSPHDCPACRLSSTLPTAV